MILADYIARHLAIPFTWGYNDCVRFASGWIKESTGKDYLLGMPRWASAIQAARILHSHGGLMDIVDRKLQRVEKNYALDGHLALHQGALRIYVGSHICGPGANGLVFFDRAEAECAWRLPGRL